LNSKILFNATHHHETIDLKIINNKSPALSLGEIWYLYDI